MKKLSLLYVMMIVAVTVMAQPNAPTNLTVTRDPSDNQRVILSWTAPEGDFASYKIYRNTNGSVYSYTVQGNKTSAAVGSLTAGVHEFYMRSVGSDEQLSIRTSSQHIRIFNGYEPKELTASVVNDVVKLNWTAPESENSTLSYPFDASSFSKYAANTWSQKFLATTLQHYQGMAITSVKLCVSSSCLGDYTLKITQTSAGGTALYTETKSMTSSGWQTFTLANPVVIDCTKPLYITFTTSGLTNPATYYANDEGATNSNAMMYLKESDGKWYVLTTRTAAIRTYFTDGTYTYNLYRDGEALAGDLTELTYSDDASGFGDEYYHKYEVKSVHHAIESEASNYAAISAGATKYFFNDGDWNTAANWTNGAIPGTTDAAVIDAEAQLNASTLVANMTVNTGKSVSIASDVRLDVTGTLVNADASGIVLEDGAQLNHRTSGVFATYKKDIAAFTRGEGPDGWNLISMPLAYTNTQATGGQRVHGLITDGTEDFYYYDEPTYYWMNYKTTAFGISTKKGYLYANSQDTQIVFTGQTQSASSITINDLSYQGAKLNGFNLIGNPFPCNADVVVYYNSTNYYTSDYYVMNADGSELIKADGHTIAPCQAIFVKASPTFSTYKFYKPSFPSAKGEECVMESEPSLSITLKSGDNVIDRASIHQGEGQGLDKFNLYETSTRIYLSDENGEYASLYVGENERVEMGFKTQKTGSYRLVFDLEGMNYEYLHLVDHLTGMDVDLLANGGSYEFEGSAADYAARFHLDFVAPANDNVSNVANIYYAEGRLIIPEAGINSTLEVIDMMGRVVSRECVSGSYDRQFPLTPGVYVVRLNSDCIKIVVD